MNKKNLKEFVQKVEENTNETLEDTLLDDEASLEDTRAIRYEDIALNTTKDKISKLPWLTAIFLILIISIVFGVMFLNSNPQTIFTTVIDKFFSSITDNISENAYDISKGKIEASFNINSNDENADLYKQISNCKYSIDYCIDSANNMSNIIVNSKNDDKISSLYLYNDKKNSYIYSKSIYEKYIKLDKINTFKMVSPKDIKKLLNILNQALDKVATSEKISGSKVNYDEGIKTIKAYESKLVINSSNYERVFETFINTLKSNNEFINVISKNSNLSDIEVKSILDHFFKYNFNKDDSIEISLYTNRKSNEFIKGEIIGDSFNFSIVYKDSSYELNLKSAEDNDSLNINAILNKEKTIYNLNGEFKLQKESNVVSGNFDIIFNKGKSTTFKKVDLKDVISESKLTDDDKLLIYNNMSQDPNFSYILKYIK